MLHVVHGFPPGRRLGTEIYTYSLCKELAKRNDVHVLYPVHEGRRRGLNCFGRDSVEVHELHVPMGLLEAFARATDFNATYGNKYVEQRFTRLLDAVRPDVVHFQHLINLSASIVEIVRSRGLPAVLTLHDFWFMCPTINLLRPDATLCEGPDDSGVSCFECWDAERAQVMSNLLSRYPLVGRAACGALGVVRRLRNPGRVFVARRDYLKSLLLMADRIIAPSGFLMDVFVRYGVPPERIAFIDKGFDIGVFKDLANSPDLESKHGRRLVFGYVGGLGRYKGFDVLIEAFDRVPGEDAELRIYGRYDPASREFRDAQSTVRNPSIRFLGRYDDVRKPYSEIDVLIFPSICYENRPLVLTEAVAAQTPVIASNLGSMPELITDGQAGLLFEAGNAGDLYSKIMTVIRNPSLLQGLRQGRKEIKTIEQEAAEVEEVYRSVLHCQGQS